MNYSFLFSGHMVDAEKSIDARFPDNKKEHVKNKMRQVLMAAIKEVTAGKEISTANIRGIAGGACGGDIIFHELCLEKEINIPTEIYLALPVEKFRKASVSFAGKEWDKRFDHLLERLPVHILPGIKNDDNGKDPTIWVRTNLWMLDHALGDGDKNMSLIALWDGKKGDGPGGTEDMVLQTRARGAKVFFVDIGSIDT